MTLEIAQLEEHPAVIDPIHVTGRPRVRSAVSRIFAFLTFSLHF